MSALHKNAFHDVTNLAGQVVNIDPRPFYKFNEAGNIVFVEPSKAEVLAFAIEEDRAHLVAKVYAAAFGPRAA